MDTIRYDDEILIVRSEAERVGLIYRNWVMEKENQQRKMTSAEVGRGQ